MDNIPDNYGTYSGDGMDDDWQIDHFGFDNPLAAALLDPDGDGQSNRFEFAAGLVPTDAKSRFSLRIEKVTGQPGHMRLVFHPRLEGRTYAVQWRLSLVAVEWAPLSAAAVIDAGEIRTVTDPAATSVAKFYRIEITKP